MARVAIREERVYFERIVPLFNPVFISFSVVDYVVAPHRSIFLYMALRFLAVVVAYISFQLLRGRVRYGFRNFMLGFPLVLYVEIFMLANHLTYTPYYAGFGLVMYAWSFCVPAKLKVSLTVCVLMTLPVPLWFLYTFNGDYLSFFLVTSMTLGTALVCALGSDETNKEVRERFVAEEQLARHLGARQKIIDSKVKELFSRKLFEDQFSPQVVDAVLKEPAAMKQMRKQEISVIVVDIEESTKKSQSLPSAEYKEVVEEVFDVFSSACLNFNITVDKFTGDGAQAFAGAPVASENNAERSVLACKKAIQMLKSRTDRLDVLWNGKLNVRFAICEGSALVGFLGRGTLKSFTAIGETVSFTHRLCGSVPPWSIGFYSYLRTGSLPIKENLETSIAHVTDLKGFGKQTFEVQIFTVNLEKQGDLNFGRCEQCGTPLVLDDSGGIFKVSCPGCLSRHEPLAA